MLSFTSVSRLVLIMCVTLAAHAGPLSAKAAPAEDAPAATIEGLAALSADSGWLLLDQRLYRTQTGGRDWEDITPEAGAFSIQALTRLDEQRGWLALAGADAEGEPDFALSRTSDGGATWHALPLDLFQRGEADALAEKVFLYFVDSQTGWLVIKRATSANFSLGTLFKTSDGGVTWTRLTVPIGEPVYFTSREEGWVSGGVTGDEHYRTLDGGATWQSVSLAEVRAPEPHWALVSEGKCDGATCTTTTTLRRATDGVALPLPTGKRAITAQSSLPAEVDSASGYAEAMANGNPVRWQTATGQGFDSCTLPSLWQMQDWYNNSPYRVWNLYIGGSSRAPCGTLTASYIATLAVQGWRLIPTWVGPQAACSDFASRMSWNPDEAYQQGRAEADAAVTRAAELGLTFSNDAGTLLYYDLEAYFPAPGDTACREAARSFMNGWTQRVRERGNLAGVYGSTCRSYLSDFVSTANVPDAIWAAVWLLPYQYRPSVSVFNLPCLDNSLWVNQQRLRQYSGGHNETWGNTTLNIDSNVLDGPVASLRDPAPLPQAAEFYRDFDYVDGSACSLNQTGWFNAEECGAGWNDQLSSLRLRLGWSARVFRDTNLAGPSYCYVLSDPDFANDRFDATTLVENNVSSVKVYDNAGCVDFFTYLPLLTR
jgi:hypothetical protein